MLENEEYCGCKSTFCESPLIELYRRTVSVVNLSVPTVTLAEALEKILTEGLYLSAHGKYCCPDCNPKKGYYYLGDAVQFYAIAELYGQISINGNPATGKYPCCLNHHLSTREAIQYRLGFLGIDPPCCDTNFTDVVSQLHEITANFEITNFIETNTFNGSSGLKSLLDYIQSDVDYDYDYDTLSLFFEKLFELGLVIKCFDCDIFIGSVQSFETFGAAYNIF